MSSDLDVGSKVAGMMIDSNFVSVYSLFYSFMHIGYIPAHIIKTFGFPQIVSRIKIWKYKKLYVQFRFIVIECPSINTECLIKAAEEYCTKALEMYAK